MDLIKVKILKTVPGSIDGLTVKIFRAGDIVEIPKSLSDVFLQHNFADEYTDKKNDDDEEIKKKKNSNDAKEKGGKMK